MPELPSVLVTEVGSRALLSEFHKFAIPTAYGIHHRIDEKLTTLFGRSSGQAYFFFYEYILENPITFHDDCHGVEELDTQQVLAPFLRRYAHKIGMMPKVDLESCKQFKAAVSPEIPRMIPITPQNAQRFWVESEVLPIHHKPSVLRTCVRTWKAQEEAEAGNFKGTWKRDGICQVRGEETPDGIRKLLETYKESPEGLLSLQLREFALVLNPFLQGDDTQKIQVLSYSLSSATIFWGQCLVIFPWDGQIANEEFVKALDELMIEEIRDIYVPVLTLLLNSVYEKKLEKDLTPDVPGIISQSLISRLANGEWKYPDSHGAPNTSSPTPIPTPSSASSRFQKQIFLRLVEQLNAKLEKGQEPWTNAIGSLSDLEKGLLELWSERESPVMKKRPELVKKTLLFSKYSVASPALIDRVQQASRFRHKRSKKDPNVVSALVVGGPGSGKDTMAKLIWLFSPGFRCGGLCTLNMAMFRPKEAAVPVLLGLNASEGITKGSSPIPIELEGLFLRAMRCHEDSERAELEKIEAELKAIDHEPQVAKGFTFIFDELNSLDIDTQGALLRFLENAELTPLGGVNNPLQAPQSENGRPQCSKDILVIAVMNEDPHLIMKRQEMDRILQQNELFGTILGQTLHELLRGQRRLRDDLYYRLIRGGEIVMPSLHDRREDIPILVFDNISRLIDLFPEGVNDFEIELAVYDILMSESLPWEGNLRELQTFARKLVIEAKTVFTKDHPGEVCQKLFISGAHARHVLQQHQAPRVRGSAV
jgi:hypothetical protein